MTTAVLIDKIQIVLRESGSHAECVKKINKIISDFDNDLDHNWNEDANVADYRSQKAGLTAGTERATIPSEDGEPLTWR